MTFRSAGDVPPTVLFELRSSSVSKLKLLAAAVPSAVVPR